MTIKQQTTHGGRLIAARLNFPKAPEPFIDLSTGISPAPYPLPPLPAACFTRLPEPEEERALQQTACERYGLGSPDLVAAAPGTQALIQTLPRLFPATRVGVLSPTYAEHQAAWPTAVPVATAEALADFDVGVLCNPNNPDGRIVPAPKLLSLADALARRGGFLLVDEAFADFSPGVSVAPALPHPGLVVLRSFGKAFGLAGLRLGFMLADAPLAARMRAALGPWAVSGPALLVGRLALSDTAWVTEAAARAHKDAARLDGILQDAGLTLVGGTALFRLARTHAASRVANHLGEAGILVRTFEAQPEWLRFGLPGAPAEWDRLQAALNRTG